MKRFFGISLWILGWMLAQPSQASDLIISRCVLEDKSGTLTIADVAGGKWTPEGPTISMGNTRSALWMRLQVHAPAHGSEVVLFIRPSFLNEIRLYEAGPGNPAGWKTRVTGSYYPYRQRDRDSVSLGFVVNVTGPEATYYLRVKTRSTLLIEVEALEPEEALRKDNQRDLLEVFFATSMLCLLLWATHSYFLDRQPVVGLFAIHQATYILFGIVATGYLAPLTTTHFPQLLDRINAILYLGIGCTNLIFCRELFKPYKPPPQLMRGLTLALGVPPILFAALLFGFNTLAISGNAIFIKISLVYFVIVAVSLRQESTPRRSLLRIFFVCILMTNVTFWLASRSGSITSKINVSAMQTLILDGLVIGGLFALILHTRTRLAFRDAHESALNLCRVQKEFEVERELREQFKVEAQTDFLTGLCNRRHFSELAKRELARAVRFKRSLALLMIDIDHFKVINDTWGHGTGDVVLRKVSMVIRDTLRDEDILGRTGGEEFAVMIVETEGEEALVVAQRLCATVASSRFCAEGGGHVPVTVSIGLTELRGRKIAFADLLREADEAMYNAKRAGRNCTFVSSTAAVEAASLPR